MIRDSYYQCVLSGYHDYMAKLWAKREEEKVLERSQGKVEQ